MRAPLATLAFALLLAALAPGCDSSDPSGPRTRFIVVTATPDEIEVGENAGIVVTATKSDGGPAAGETVSLTTTLGTLEETSLVLDAVGREDTVLQAGDTAGTATVSATITAGAEPSTGSTTVAIIETPLPPGELDVQPRGLDLTHSRAVDPCPNPYQPPLMLSNVGVADLDFEVVDDLPEWLGAEAFEGEVPGTLEVHYTCSVDEGDVDLAHMLQIQGIDRASQEPVGAPAVVSVTLQVRD